MTSNHTNRATSPFLVLPPRHAALIVFEVGIAFLINITALLGNILVCCAVYRNTRLRTITNYSIVSLAISDMVFAVLCLPFSLGVLIEGRWLFGNVVCGMQAYLVNCLAFVSIITMSFTAVNRYCKIVRSVAFNQRHFTRRKTVTVTLSIWFVVFSTMALPLATGWARTGFYAPKAICILFYYSSRPLPLTAMITIILLFLAIPWIAALVCYARVFAAIRRHKKAVEPSSNSRLGPSVEDINVTRTLFAVVLGFSICWLPMLVVTVLTVLGIDISSRPVHMTYSVMGALSSAINPLIYGVMNKAFRREYRNILTSFRSDSTQATGGSVVTMPRKRTAWN